MPQPDERETDEELKDRYQRCKEEHKQAKARMERSKLGSAERSRKARWVGCLYFNVLQIQTEMEERGLIRYPCERDNKCE